MMGIMIAAAFFTEDPFDIANLSDGTFQSMFQVTKRQFRRLLNEIKPYMTEATISKKRKLLAFLRFMAGGYPVDVATNEYVQMSKSNVSKSISEVLDALCTDAIFRKWVHLPRTYREYKIARQKFMEVHNFPGAFGVIDCIHVAINPPSSDPYRPEHVYINRRKFHSINVQVICDWESRIINVNPKFPGCTHDAYIWANSIACRAITHLGNIKPNEVFYLLGDKSYPLRRVLLTPAKNVNPGTPESRYNDKHDSVRSSIKLAHSAIQDKCINLLKHQVLPCNPPKAWNIIIGCAVLHNIILGRPVIVQDSNMTIPIYNVHSAARNKLYREGVNVRQHFITNYFE